MFKAFGVTQSGIEPMTSRTPDKHSTTGLPGAVPLPCNTFMLYSKDSCFITQLRFLKHYMTVLKTTELALLLSMMADSR